MEENAYLVVRLLIRRPECFGPALRGEGGNGLLATIEDAIRISKDQSMDGSSRAYHSSSTLLVTSSLHLSLTPSVFPSLSLSLLLGVILYVSPLSPTLRDSLNDEDEDCIHMGRAVITFYSALVDLLGRCAPEMHVSVRRGGVRDMFIYLMEPISSSTKPN